MKTNKLYLVTCRGLYKEFQGYVVAQDPSKAYQMLKESLESRQLDFAENRELKKIELIAEDKLSPDCGTQLYLDLLIMV